MQSGHFSHKFPLAGNIIYVDEFDVSGNINWQSKSNIPRFVGADMKIRAVNWYHIIQLVLNPDYQVDLSGTVNKYLSSILQPNILFYSPHLHSFPVGYRCYTTILASVITTWMHFPAFNLDWVSIIFHTNLDLYFI